jgi:hypothetical protein
MSHQYQYPAHSKPEKENLRTSGYIEFVGDHCVSATIQEKCQLRINGKVRLEFPVETLESELWEWAADIAGILKQEPRKLVF